MESQWWRKRPAQVGVVAGVAVFEGFAFTAVQKALEGAGLMDGAVVFFGVLALSVAALAGCAIAGAYVVTLAVGALPRPIRPVTVGQYLEPAYQETDDSSVRGVRLGFLWLKAKRRLPPGVRVESWGYAWAKEEREPFTPGRHGVSLLRDGASEIGALPISQDGRRVLRLEFHLAGASVEPGTVLRAELLKITKAAE